MFVRSTILQALRQRAFGVWLFLGVAVGNACAAERADLLAQFPARIAQAGASDLVTGAVDGRRYIALRFDAGDGAPEHFQPVLLIARPTGTGYAHVAHFRLDQLQDLDAWFARDSIFVRRVTAHGGIYSSRYQFRLLGGRFRLVGVEQQSNTLGVPPNRDASVALWESRSANLLTRTVVYRAQVYDPLDDATHKEALRRFDAGLPPIRGRTKIVNLPSASVFDRDLDGFDPYQFRAEFLCHYFDHALVFHDACGATRK